MKHFASIVIGVMTGVAIYFCLDYYHKTKTETGEVQVVVDTIYDTIPFMLPVPYDSVVLRTANRLVAVSDNVKDSVTMSAGDSIPVSIPITQKAYRDSTYVAWVSGFEPQLDSIKVFQKTVNSTVYQTKYLKPKPNRWGFGVQVGAEYNSNQIKPYVGIGVSYNLFTW